MMNEKIPFPGLKDQNDTAYRERQKGIDSAVNHPSHYTSGKFEVIDIIEDQLGLEGLRGFCLGNTIKYICRAGKKNPSKLIEDLEKAEWYLHHYLHQVHLAAAKATCTTSTTEEIPGE